MRRLALVLTTPVVIASIAFLASCRDLEPEVGDSISACVDVDSNPTVDVSFARDIRPIMNGAVGGAKPCKNCHYHSTGTHEGLQQTGLDMETLGSLRNGGHNSGGGIIAIPGKPCESVIVQKVRGTFPIGVRMPKGGPYLAPEQIQLLADWVFEGAKGDPSE